MRSMPKVDEASLEWWFSEALAEGDRRALDLVLRAARAKFPPLAESLDECLRGAGLAPTDEERAHLVAALAADGFRQPELLTVWSQWEDPAVTWLRRGLRSVLTITSTSKTMSGWQVRVIRRHIYVASGRSVPFTGASGVMHADRLVETCRPYIDPREGTGDAEPRPVD